MPKLLKKYAQHFYLKAAARCIGLLLTLVSTAYAQRPGNELEPSRSHADTTRQVDLIDIAKNLLKISPPKGPDSTEGKQFYFSFLPFSSEVPGGGTALITSTTAGFYKGDRNTTNMSRITFTPYWNFGKRFGLPIRSYVWFKNNEWVIMGDTRFLRYPQYTWGLGNQYGEEDKFLINYTYIRFYQHALRRLSNHFYVGLGYNMDSRMNIRADAENGNFAEYVNYDYGTGDGSNSLSSGVSLNLLYDTRTNSINPLDGCYAYFQYRVNPTLLGSDHLWRSTYLDLRKYFRFTQDVNKQNMLGLWMYYWGVLDTAVPYLDLPSIGWDVYNRSGRGFDQNRHRGRHLLYFESEYRKDITANGLLGFVVFANTNTVSGPKSRLMRDWHAAIGTGLRIKFNKGAGTNIAIDFGKSKDFSGFQIGLDEVF
ncbi:BamA/TamA family outer membrane protein [Olivibacter sitiensis]|uniref:BamA/TamA family outer membrane protein n=1 Tax=Olivibacter sitiensis TaxID=376470 RepID=UPI00068724AE|nr:BamA/TamA family outer membrane protein [Olivibacter sitiensis]